MVPLTTIKCFPGHHKTSAKFHFPTIKPRKIATKKKQFKEYFPGNYFWGFFGGFSCKLNWKSDPGNTTVLVKNFEKPRKPHKTLQNSPQKSPKKKKKIPVN